MPHVESRVRARLFGRMEIRRGGARIVNFPYDKVQALLAYLLLETPKPHARDRLAGLLWPTDEEAAARHSLRQALFQLRKALAEKDADVPLILATRTAIRRNPDAPLEMDVVTFDRLLAQATDREKEGVPEQAAQALSQAIDLYRGEILPELSPVDAVPFQHWLQGKRQKYHERAVRVLEQLLEQVEVRQDERKVLRYAQRLVALEPWRETAQRELMLLLARQGRRAAALKQYESCRETLEEMLDVAPATETERLYRRIRQMASARLSLPNAATPFIGRQRELQELLRILRKRAARLITISGMGGMGKTRLAIEAGRRAGQEGVRLFLHGIVFVPLDAVGSADQLVLKIAQAFDFSFEGQEASTSQLLGFLRNRELMLILDQFEHLLNKDSLTFLSKLMDTAPDVTLLVTSRRRLGLQGEHLYPLGGLPLAPQNGEASTVDEKANATDLLMAAARRLQPAFELNDESRADAADICRLVDGMPLALELAASWTDALPLHEIARALRNDLDLLETSAVDVAPRHHSIRAMFDGAWQGLERGERQVMAQLSIFRGDFTLAAARAVSDASPRVLSRLVARSLVQYDAEQDRYYLHPLLQKFSAEKRRVEGIDSDDLRDRHSAYYLRRLGQLAGDLPSARDKAALEKIDADIGNVRQAWQWATQQGPAERLDAASSSLHHYYHRRGRYAEGADAFADALYSVRQGAQIAQGRVEAKLLAFQADMLRQQGDVDRAHDLLHESLRLLQEDTQQGRDARRVKAFVNWRMALLTKEAAEARPLLENSLALYRELQAPGRVAALLAALGLLYKATGDLEQAEACFDESMALRRRLETPAQVVELSFFLAELRMRQGRFAESEALLQESLDRVRQIGDQPSVAMGLFQWGIHCYYAGRYHDAVTAWQKSLTIWEDLGRDRGMLIARGAVGVGLLHTGAYEQARRAAERALSLVETLTAAPFVGTALQVVGGALLAEGNVAKAYEKLSESAAVYASGWRQDWRARQVASRAYAAFALCYRGELQRARERLGETLDEAVEVRSLYALMSTLPAIALWLVKEGQTGRAIEVWSAACSQPHVANSRWFADVVGRPVDEAAATLSEDAVAAATERGRAWEQWDLANELLLLDIWSGEAD